MKRAANQEDRPVGISEYADASLGYVHFSLNRMVANGLHNSHTLRMKPYAIALMLLSLVQAGRTPQFEVTSVKPNMTGRGGPIDMPPTGRVSFVSAQAEAKKCLKQACNELTIPWPPH